MRPQGEVRMAVVSCIQTQPSTLREIVSRANVGYGKARQALDAAVRSGQIAVAGTRREPHSKRPVAVYETAEVLDDLAAWQDVHDVFSAWAR